MGVSQCHAEQKLSWGFYKKRVINWISIPVPNDVFLEFAKYYRKLNICPQEREIFVVCKEKKNYSVLSGPQL